MNDTIRVGLVGCGRWGRNILRDLLLLGCTVEIADPDSNSRRGALEQGAAAAVPSPDQWRLGDFDGFVVAVPIPLHGAIVNQLLAGGKPVYCEKPLTDDAAQAHDIAAHGSDRVFVMHKWRYHPGIEAIAALAQDATFGRVREIVTRRLQWTPPHDRADAIWTLAPHDLSIVVGILGHMPGAIAATGQSDANGRPRSLIGLLCDKDGPSVAIHVAANWPRTERSVCVAFESAIALMDDPLADHIRIFRNRGGALGDEERYAVSTEYPLLRELRAFTEHIRGGPPPKTTAAEGALVVATIERLRSLAGIDRD